MDIDHATRKVKSLGALSSTLFYPLIYRAAITARKTFFQDPFAIRLAKQFHIQYDKVNLHEWPLLAPRLVGRAYQFDHLLEQFLKANPHGTVVNIGAGLDTTFMRLDNAKLTWVDLDFPKVIALRKKLMPKNSRVHMISKSVLDLSWINDIQKYPGPYFFMAGGVFMYITEKQTKTIITRLAKKFPGSEIVFDPCSKEELRQSNLIAKRAKASNVKDTSDDYKWGTNNPKIFSRWSPKIKLISAMLCNDGIKSKIRLSKAENQLTAKLGEEVIGYVIHLRFQL